MTLIEALQQVPDHRCARGKRHPLWVILVIIVMGNLAGYWGNRPLAEFARRYGPEIAELLGIDAATMPSFSTFRRIHMELDFTAFSEAFRQWMQQAAPEEEPVYAIDGKRMTQPVEADDGRTLNVK